jgi:hypothetical protein
VVGLHWKTPQALNRKNAILFVDKYLLLSTLVVKGIGYKMKVQDRVRIYSMYSDCWPKNRQAHPGVGNHGIRPALW